MTRGILDRTCPTCGVEIGFGLWAHMLECAKQKEQRERAERAVENGKRLVKRLSRKRAEKGEQL